MSPDLAEASGRRRLLWLVLVLGVFGLVTPIAAAWSQPLTTAVRVLVAVLLLFPAGLFMGMAFPLGMKLAAARAQDLTPWLWGLNGAASVLASVPERLHRADLVDLAAFWTGWVCYVGAIAAFIAASRQPRPSGAPISAV